MDDPVLSITAKYKAWILTAGYLYRYLCVSVYSAQLCVEPRRSVNQGGLEFFRTAFEATSLCSRLLRLLA